MYRIGEFETAYPFRVELWAGVGDMRYPCLLTIDSLGRKMDSIYAQLFPCGTDEGCSYSSWAEIQADYRIVRIDSSFYFSYRKPEEFEGDCDGFGCG